MLIAGGHVMALIGLVSPLDTPEAVTRWSFAHARDHDEIDQALLAKLGTPIDGVPLDPMPALDEAEAWLLRHQLKHAAMNAALQLSGENLTVFDLSTKEGLTSFAGANFSEHDSVHQTLAALGVQVSG